MSAHECVLKIRVIAFCLGNLLSNNPWEREVEFITLVEKKPLHAPAGNRWDWWDSSKKNYVHMEPKHYEKIAF